jgi:putative endonuclease
MEKYRQKLGEYGEGLACQFLTKRGYVILDRNFSSRYGEIDIVAQHPEENDLICCLEVKTRISTDFGSPEDAITYNKIRRLHDTACSYFFQRRIENKFFRLDVISIVLDRENQKAKIKHLKSVGFENLRA